MKKTTGLLLAFIAFFGLSGFAQSDGIAFQSGKKWDEVLAMAKAENKLIFVDVYTDWCGPCKRMDAEVFPKKMVGDKFNASFINYKLDAEKGEGPAVAKKYLVKSYPNYLFVNGDGVLIYRSTSSMTPAEFLDVAKNAVTEAKQAQTVVQLDLLYSNNKNDKTFMYNYLTRRTTLRLDNADLLDEYITLLSETERGEIKNLQLILDNGMFLAKNVQLGIALETLKQHSAEFASLKQSYKESLDGIVNTAISTTLRKAIEKGDAQLLTKVLALKKEAKASPFDNKQTTQLAYYYGTGQRDAYFNAAKSYVNNFLLKFSLDTLKKWDAYTFAEQKKYLAQDKNFKGNIDEEAQDYKHTQTIQLTNAISNIIKNFIALNAEPADLKTALSWSDYSLKITASDPVYYQNVIPFYTESNAIMTYKVGDKKIAIAKMEQMIRSVNNPKAAEYFAPLLNKMKANEIL